MYISDRGQVRLQEVMKFINKSKTRTYEIIEGLVRKGLVYRNGKGRNTTYVSKLVLVHYALLLFQELSKKHGLFQSLF